MKKTFLLFVLTCLFLTSCRTKTKTVSHSETISEKKIENIVSKKLDSFSQTLKINERVSEQKLNEVITQAKEDISVKLKLQRDSLGNIIPSKYEKIVDGILREKIEVTGGEISYSNFSNNENKYQEQKSYDKDMEYIYSAFEVMKEENAKLNERIFQLENKKEVEVKVKDFSLWIYILTGILAVFFITLAMLFIYLNKQIQALIPFS